MRWLRLAQNRVHGEFKYFDEPLEVHEVITSSVWVMVFFPKGISSWR